MTTALQSRSYPEHALLDDGEMGGGLSSMLSLSTIRGIVYRQRFMLIGIITLALVAALVITLLTRPLYSASTTVRIDPLTSNIVDGQNLEPEVPVNEIDRYMQTQATVITSRRIAYQVVDTRKLDTREDFLGDFATKRPDGMSDKDWKHERREAAAGMVQGGVKVDVPMENRVITITYTSPSAKLAAEVANAVADVFVQEDLRRALETNVYAQNYLKGQIEKLQRSVQNAEEAANAYAKANGIVAQAPMASSATDGDTSQTVTVATLATVNETYTAARTKRIAAEQRWNAVSGVPAGQLPEVQQNNAIQGMIAERSKAITELSQLRQRYGESYPRLRELNAQVSSLTTQINKASNDIKSAIRDDYTIALRQEQALEGELNKVSGKTLDEQDRRVRYNMLDREATAQRTQLASLLTRYNEISSAANLKPGTSSKLDAAQVPGGPVSPNLPKNMLIGLFLGSALALAIAVLREAFDDRLRTTEDVERKLGLPLLGYTPDISDRDVIEEINDPFSILMEAYSSIRSSIDFAVPGNHRVLQVTSSEPSEGKSLTASTIARKYAQLGRKTLLIDADLRKPSLFALFGTTRPKSGFVEVLLGDVRFEDALIPNTPENLDVLPVAPSKVNPVELLSSQVLTDFVEKYREQYSLIIFDSVPVMGLADAPLLSRIADATVFIVEANRAHYGQAKTAVRRLMSAGARMAGVVLTKYRAAEAGMSYDYHYQYYAYGERSKD
ncbi:GumC family protein [Novosphingobium jiangmenense]|uniref:non-specific protein-tyrosine kinase n=1 Tax=Novosphingobium jiangmenense TaxID=2791981 RepID=A0ABS0HEV8_9SPHN|nr:polysaccharide biosynthesis tyrosine autokinase [Novosphingobium jiangmenense]MBF9150796.1 polysaccharide biosynthesis tyrosine autokinase [Novosphingobium jiangmenense]